MLRHIFFTGIFCCIVTMSHLGAQTVIRGKVVDEITGEPIISAIVEFKEEMKGSVTDFKGEYYLKVDTILPVQIKISYTGYETVLLEISDASIPILTKLREQIIELQTAEIVGSIVPEKFKKSALVVESL